MILVSSFIISVPFPKSASKCHWVFIAWCCLHSTCLPHYPQPTPPPTWVRSPPTNPTCQVGPCVGAVCTPASFLAVEGNLPETKACALVTGGASWRVAQCMLPRGVGWEVAFQAFKESRGCRSHCSVHTPRLTRHVTAAMLTYLRLFSPTSAWREP